MNQARLRIILATLLVVALILAFQFGGERAVRDQVGDQAAADKIDFFISDGVLTRWTTDGSRESVTSTDYLRHSENRNRMWLTNPYTVGYLNNTEISHTLSSETAIYLDDNSLLELAGTVELHHNPGTEQETGLFTEKLFYFPEQQIARSDEQVEILNSQGQTYATGMNYYANEKRIELLSNVRGTYVSGAN